MQNFYVCEVAPDNFLTADEVESALKNAESGDIYNIQFLVSTLLADLKAQEKKENKPCRLMMVIDVNRSMDRRRRRPAPPPSGIC